MEHSTLKYQRVLEAKAAELAADLRDRGDIAIHFSAEEVERIVLAGQRDLAIRSIDRTNQLLRTVRAALQKVAGGGFGRCEECQQRIPAKRLDALPWAQHCVDCQEVLDQHPSPETVQNFRFAA